MQINLKFQDYLNPLSMNKASLVVFDFPTKSITKQIDLFASKGVNIKYLV